MVLTRARNAGQRGALLAAIVASIGFLVWGFAWAVNSPVGASPDDDFHLASIWCEFGTREGVCEEIDESPRTVNVPAQVADSSACFRFSEGSSGACTESITGTSTNVTRINDGEYPRVFYSTMALLVGSDVTTSVIVMRLFNVLAGALLLFGALTLTQVTVRRAFTLAFVAVISPLAIFLVASTNPNGWTILGAAFYWVFLYTWLTADSTTSRLRSVLLLLGIIASAVMLVGSRADGAVVAVVSTISVGVLVLRNADRIAWVRWLPAVITVIASVAVVLGTNQIGMATSGDSESWDPGTQEISPVALFIHNVQNIPTLLLGAVGGSPLGWLDTAIPAVVVFTGALMLGAIALIGTMDFWWRKAIAVILMLGVTLGPPMVVLQANNHFAGQAVQARYLLPGLVVFLGMLLLFRSARPWPISSVFRWTFVVLLTFSSTVAFWSNAMRYSLPDGWSLVSGLAPVTLTLIALIASGVFFIAMTSFLVSSREERSWA